MTDDRLEITLRDLWEEQKQTGAQVSAVVGQIALLTAQVGDRLDSGQKKMDDHELRIRVAEQLPKVSVTDFQQMENRVGSLEKFRYWLLGAAAAIGTAAGIISAIVERVK
jgi:hypothetical protein